MLNEILQQNALRFAVLLDLHFSFCAILSFTQHRLLGQLLGKI